MTSAINEDELQRGLQLHSTPLAGLVEAEFQWNLGQVTIKKNEALFRVGYWESLRSDSRFYKVAFDFGSDRRGVAAVFRVTDPLSADADFREYVVGWVPREREVELDHWIAFLNAEIAKRLASPERAATRKPIRMGVFKELGFHDDPTAPSLASVRGKRTPDHKAEVLAYLRRGRTTSFSPGVQADVFDETKLADTLSVRTDGTYAWPEVLAYYVEQYDVALPADFEEHMRNNRWQVPRHA